jgi:FkbM family methyltransferase
MQMTSSFKEELAAVLKANANNNFGRENYDEERFGTYTGNRGLKRSIKWYIKKAIGLHVRRALLAAETWSDHYERLERMYQSFIREDQKLLVMLVAYRILGFRNIKLPSNCPKYWNAVNKAKELKDPNDTYDPHFMHFILEKFDLNPIGYDLRLYFSDAAIAIDFINQQYTYRKNDFEVSVKPGDVVFDLGGCWGDTALYFATKVGADGKVYSFEFIPDNIKLFNINTSLNPAFMDRIELVRHPVTNVAGEQIYFKDWGPGSRVERNPFAEQTGVSTTTTIDDFVRQRRIPKVDFIKMDIEGSEPAALEGARETILKYRPKLAIAIYHSVSDFVGIPNWILDLNIGYKIFIDHFTIHSEETVCYAMCEPA